MLRSRWSFSSLPPLRASRGKDGVGRGRREGKEPQKESPKECGVFEREGDQQSLPWLDLLGQVPTDKPSPTSCAARFGK